jgi:hypothetical protein
MTGWRVGGWLLILRWIRHGEVDLRDRRDACAPSGGGHYFLRRNCRELFIRIMWSVLIVLSTIISSSTAEKWLDRMDSEGK